MNREAGGRSSGCGHLLEGGGPLGEKRDVKLFKDSSGRRAEKAISFTNVSSKKTRMTNKF